MTDKERESWHAIAEHLPIEGLEVLADMVRRDDVRLVQGVTTDPPYLPNQGCEILPCEGGCAVSVAMWRLQEMNINEVSEMFSRVIDATDNSVKNVARPFLWWFDHTPREEMLREFLPEVEAAIANKAKEVAA